MLRRVGIPTRRIASTTTRTSSGRMRQRIAIAMALLMNPGLLIADEPTTSLDVTLEAQIIHLLRVLRATFHGSILPVSHNLGLIAELCDLVAVMYAGRSWNRGPSTTCSTARATRTRSGSFSAIPPWSRPTGAVSFYDSGTCRTWSPSHLAACSRRGARARSTDAAPRRRRRSASRPHTARCHLLVPRVILPSVDALRVRFPRMGPLAAPVRVGDRFIDALAGVSLRVPAGGAFGLVGESGSGKSTLARTVFGLVPAETGSIRFDGTELIGLGERELKRHRRSMAMMFQDPVASLSPRLTVRSLVSEPFRIHGFRDRDRGAEAARLLDLVGLSTTFLGAATRTSCPGGKPGAWAWRGRSRCRRGSWLPTSRRRAWTSRCRARC